MQDERMNEDTQIDEEFVLCSAPTFNVIPNLIVIKDGVFTIRQHNLLLYFNKSSTDLMRHNACTHFYYYLVSQTDLHPIHLLC
jgi:hypothetical protein